MEIQLKSKTDIKSFLEHAECLPVVDVRSPSEYNHGHIPGAVNLPLFNDSEREAVGKKYKQEGSIESILTGLRLAGPGMHLKLEQALRICKKNELLVHCWRGGMRSEAMAWLFSLGGISSEILEGGYKSYRHYVLENLSVKRKVFILGGLTGSGKTNILKYINETGHQVIDLEELARHRGSAFGALGQPPQPSTEQFANLLFDEWRKKDPGTPLWLEDESRNIGNVFLPEEFYLNMQRSPVVVLLMDPKVRLPRLIREYSEFPPAELEESIIRISRRMGGDNARKAVDAIRNREFARAIDISLAYYDKAYLYGLKKRESDKIIYISSDTDDVKTNALKVLEAADTF